jgi:hypothetical protein
VTRRLAALLLAGCLLAGCTFTRNTSASVTSSTLPAPVTTTSTTIPVTLPPTVYQPPTTAGPIGDALRLGEGGLGRARFGDTFDKTIQFVSGVLGQEDEDSDWGSSATKFGLCPGNEARLVRWGWLVLFFVDSSPYGDGRRHFAGWRYGQDVDENALYPQGLAMSGGLAPGATLADVRKAYPDAVTVMPADEHGPDRFRVGTSFGGRLTGTSDGDRVVDLEAGISCP